MKVCVIGNMKASFTKNDYDIISKKYETILLDSAMLKGKKEYTQVLKIAAAVRKADVTFSWFGGKNSAIAVKCCKFFGKKSIVVAGGYDVVDMPEINYGVFVRARDRILAKSSLQNADLVLSVSENNQRELLEKMTVKKNKLVHNGVPVDKFYPKGKKENIILTVAEVNKSNWKRKGLDNFVKVAEYFYSIGRREKFIVCGEIVSEMRAFLDKYITLPNVLWMGRVSDEDLLRYFQRAKIYLQLSRHEGFGVAVAEAMLCKCYPIVSAYGALPEVVGDTGIVISRHDFWTAKNGETALDKKAVGEKIFMILNKKNPRGHLARKRILENFSLARREQQLLDILESFEYVIA